MADEEIVDPLNTRREKCRAEDPKCVKLTRRLENCNARVAKDPKSGETCFEEIIDLVNCIDHCAMHGLFSKLK